MQILPIVVLAMLGQASAKRHGKNKACEFTFECTTTNDCDTAKMEAWIFQACQGIGGDRTVQSGGVYTGHGDLTGHQATCLCAHGNTKDHTYDIASGALYSGGKAKLNCDVTAPYNCQS
ncbi:extracellular 5 [Fusarium denticulatum]|uniref:Extracellular 5 n=1 Tax=Fusarium denticulatum TaxID=48507 RepID=A0A8H5X6N2_9HYPO|nr:extracellular 5 [Fusarium denticulatum]